MKRFSISKTILVLFVSLSLVSLVSCTSTKTNVADVTTPVVETMTEAPTVKPVVDEVAPVVEEEVESPVVEETQKSEMMEEPEAVAEETAVVTEDTTVEEAPAMEEAPVVETAPVAEAAPEMQYPLGITPIVKSDADYPVFDLFVVHTNDVNGKVESGDFNVGYDKLSTMLKVAKSVTDNILVLDAGNVVSGSYINNLTSGETSGTLLSLLGYDAVAPSEGDYAYGSDALLAAANFAKENTQLKVLAANVLDDELYLPFQPYQLYDYNGFTVAVVGLTAPVEGVDGLSFMNDAVIQNAQYALDMAHQYADYIIVLGNMNNGRNGGVTSSFICENLNGIDLFVDGVSDVASGTVVNGTTIVSAGQDMSSVGLVDIVVKDGKAISATPMTITANDVEDPANSALASAYGIVNIPSDKQVLSFIASQEAKIEGALSKVVATTPYTLRAEDAKKQPTSATKLMVKATTAETGADATIINGGMFAQNINAGEVTVGDIADAFAYPYTVVLKEMTGEQIYAAIEAGYSQLPEENVNYTLTDLKVIYNKYAKAGKRVLRVKLGSKNIDKEMTYTIATNQYLGNNLGRYDMGKTVGNGKLFSDILIDYLNK